MELKENEVYEAAETYLDDDSHARHPASQNYNKIGLIIGAFGRLLWVLVRKSIITPDDVNFILRGW